MVEGRELGAQKAGRLWIHQEGRDILGERERSQAQASRVWMGMGRGPSG